LIEYRRSSMDVHRESAAVWASWFRCLGDGTRVLILNRLAVARRPLSVNEIVAALDVGQSTVSHHLKILADAGFVLVERPVSTGSTSGAWNASLPPQIWSWASSPTTDRSP
jgi:DNA-binding transcriptional ArsR family regulator